MLASTSSSAASTSSSSNSAFSSAEQYECFLADNDPAAVFALPTVPDRLCDFVLRAGPYHPSASDLIGQSFPIDKSGRHFVENWYFRKGKDGGFLRRDWLAYSKKNDKVYCLHCKLFGGSGGNAPSRAWVADGFSTWKNGQARIEEHEGSQAHLLSELKLHMRKTTRPLLPSIEAKRRATVKENRSVVRQLLQIVLFLAIHCLAFRGHREGLQEKNRGIFLDLVILVSAFSPQIATYLSKLKSDRKPEVSFLSWRRQNEMIHCLADNLRQKIVRSLNGAKFFSISMDSTFDASRHEQVCFIARFANVTSGFVEERLIALRRTSSTTGEALTDLFKTVCNNLNLDWKKYMVGQSYDGASNMRGQYRGLQALIRRENPAAVYVWCWAHRLALVIVQGVSACFHAKNLFGNLESAYSFLTDGKRRVSMYEEHVMNLYPESRQRRLKRVCTTRWLSHSHALDAVIDTYTAVILTLQDIASSTDVQAAATANGLEAYFSSENFLIPAFAFQRIFGILAPFTKILQAPDIDLLQAMDMLDTSFEKISNLRSEAVLIKIIAEAREFAANAEKTVDGRIQIEPLQEKRVRKVTRRQASQSEDDPVIGSLNKLRIEFYYTVIDCILGQLRERFYGTSFEHSNQEDETAEILRDIAWLSHSKIEQVRQNSESLPQSAFARVSAVHHLFLEQGAVREQYLQFATHCKTIMANIPVPEGYERGKNWSGLSELFYVMAVSGVGQVFPDLYSLVRIAVTMPVTSVTAEVTFSKLKLVLTRLRSTMGEDRLEDLITLSCENDIDLDLERVTDMFAASSSALSRYLL